MNPVGVDAAVKPTITRCVAGGYVWNPYYTQLADPLNVRMITKIHILQFHIHSSNEYLLTYSVTCTSRNVVLIIHYVAM